MDELNCPNCGHNLYDHKTACNHRDESGHWDCECRMSGDNVEDSIEINDLTAERDALQRKLEMAKEALTRIMKFPALSPDWYRMVADEALKKLEEK